LFEPETFVFLGYKSSGTVDDELHDVFRLKRTRSNPLFSLFVAHHFVR
jgi:hypothetical protein